MALTRKGEYLEDPVLGLRLAKTSWGQLSNVRYANAASKTEEVWRAQNRAKLHIISIQCFSAHQPFAFMFGVTDHETKGEVRSGDDA
jgi:hypothetical protein